MVDCGRRRRPRRATRSCSSARQGGERIPAEEWAERLGTIAYEIVCGISARVGAGTPVAELGGPVELHSTAWLTARIRDVADFHEPGIGLKDKTPLLADREAFGVVVDRRFEHVVGAKVDNVVGEEGSGLRAGRAGGPASRRRVRPGQQGRQAPVDDCMRRRTMLEYGIDGVETPSGRCCHGEARRDDRRHA